MRIAYVFDQRLPRTSTDSEQMIQTVAAMGSEGATVDLVFPAARGEAVPTAESLAEYYEVEPTFEAHAVPSYLGGQRRLRKVSHAAAGLLSPVVRRADVLYTRNLVVVIGAVLTGLDVPVVYETYRPWYTQKPAIRPLLRRLAKRGKPDQLVLHSKLAAASFEDAGYPASDVLVAHNAWDPVKLRPARTKASARAELDLPADAKLCVYAGHVGRNKGLDLVLDMFERIPEAKLLLVGSEDPRGDIECRARTMDNVDVRPWLPFSEVVPYLYAADVLLIPPTRGPLVEAGTTVLPMKTFLYMATGRAIFGPATEDLAEVLDDGHSARLVRPDDVRPAAAALKELLADPDLCDALGAAAHAAVEHWTWRDRARRILEFIDAGTGQGPGV